MPDRAFYEEMRGAEDRHFWYAALRSLVARTLLKESVLPGSLVLDAGCGTGGTSRAIPGYDWVGMDLAADALRLADSTPAADLVRGSVTSVPFRDARFDAVVCLDVLSYVEPPLVPESLSEIRRVLRPGAVLIANMPAFEWMRGSHDQAVGTRWRSTRSEMAILVRGAGFRSVRVRHWNSILFPVMAARRLASRFLAGEGSDLHRPPGILNAALAGLLRMEGRWPVFGALPFGGSVFIVARSGAEQMDGSRAP